LHQIQSHYIYYTNASELLYKEYNVLIIGPRHFDKVMQRQIDLIFMDVEVIETPIQGFIDQFGTFLNREEALVIAKKENQIIHKYNPTKLLTSEDLY